jgi:glycosyltransferase involved in cell wall biosynthesis
MDICALTSINEGTPVAVIEAMAAAKAVVATSVGGVPDLIEHGRTGHLVPPDDADAFADAIVQLASAPGTRRQLGAAARRFVEQRFSPSRLANDIDELYQTGLSRKRR